MHEIPFIQDLAVIMLIAGLITVIFHRLRQPVVLGYILAGMIIGPYTPPNILVSDAKTLEIAAELGLIFLLFSLGMEFNLRKLFSVGATALVGAVCEIVLLTWIGYGIGRAFGWKIMDALFLGAVISVSSTTIIIKALDDLNFKHERFAQMIFGILIVEDILSIAIIALLSSLVLSGSMGGTEIAITLIELLTFMSVALIAGLLIVPRILSYVARFKNDEMLLIAVLGICFGFCLLVIKMKYSVALGAFLIGAIIAESHELKRIEHLIEPIRNMFSAIFFVAIGLLIDPRILIEFAWPIVVITIAVIVGKVIACGTGTFITGNDGKTSLRVGMGLSQIGEFSFIIASLGVTLNVTSDFLYPITVAVSAITTLLTPYLIRVSDPTSDWLGRHTPLMIKRVFTLYTEWLQSIRPTGDNIIIAKEIKRILAHVTVNIIIIMAVFLGFAFLAGSIFSHIEKLIPESRYQRALLWAVALMFSLPFLIAAYRKLKALAMILSELHSNEPASRFTFHVRKILSDLIPILSLSVFFLLVCALSASILPPFDLSIFILVAVILLGVLLARWFIKLHARLQIALLEGINEDAAKKIPVVLTTKYEPQDQTKE